MKLLLSLLLLGFIIWLALVIFRLFIWAFFITLGLIIMLVGAVVNWFRSDQ